MTDPLFEADDGTTPLDEDEADGLRLSWVRTRGDLNEAERDNILEARRSIRSATIDDVLDDHWLRQLHRRMFGDVWTWAGRYRTTERNIGIDPTKISVAVRSLAEDCRWWIEHDPPEIVVGRFHHRLVAIHPFPNGNGRHARAATDYLAQALETDPPTWGATAGAPGPELRAAYLTGLRAADRDSDDLDQLISFMWS